MMDSFEDAFLDELLENIEVIDDELDLELEEDVDCTAKSIMTSSGDDSVVPTASSHVVYVERRPYRKIRKTEECNLSKAPCKNRSRRSKSGTLPRVMKNDIRRKYAQMFANVMNSYDRVLITNFFKTFFVPDSNMLKLENTAIELNGLDSLISFYLLLWQASPDKVLQVRDIQLVKRLDNEGLDIKCTMAISYTRFYDFTPAALSKSILSEFHSMVLGSNEKLQGTVLRKRKFALESRKDGLFADNFCETRLPRLEVPVPFQCESKMTFRVNSRKEITHLICSQVKEVL